MKPAEESIALLQKLIRIESFSKKEDKTADAIADFLANKNISSDRLLNNIWAKNEFYDQKKPTILLNSHHDTVKPNSLYTRDPFKPEIIDGKLFGLGSNDAGGPLVSLLSTFLHFYNKKDLKFNLIYAATAEEEISGKNGIELLLTELPEIYFGIVGEPTQMNIAIAEKGLLVIDCLTKGKSGHSAREEGENAIYKALQDIDWFQNFKFPEISETLGPVKMSVTMINAGIQHNVVPDVCRFTVDIRTTDAYSNLSILETIKKHVSCEIHVRSIRLNPSSVNKDHPMVKAGVKLGKSLYGSPTMSDQALMNFSTFKMGPGDSSRSHSADEYIFLKEIENGIEDYIKLLTNFNSIL